MATPATAAELAADVIGGEPDPTTTDRELRDQVLRGDDKVPEPPLRDVLRKGGVGTVLVLFGLNAFDEFDRAAMATLGPEIQDSLGVGDLALSVLVGIGAAATLVAAIPLGYLADRVSRKYIVATASLVWGVAAFLGSVTTNALQLGATRILNGAGKGTEAVQRSMLADTYPIAGRGRVFALHGFANPVGNILGPLVAGGLAVAFTGDGSWRIALAVMAVPAIILAVVSLFLKEPERGAYESEAIDEADGIDAPELADETESPPVSFSAGFERLKKIRSFYAIMCAMGVMGLALAGTPAVLNLMLADRYGLDPLGRAWVATGMTLGGMVGLIVGGVQADRMFKKDPPRIVALVGMAIIAYGVAFPLGLLMPNAWLFTLYNAAVSALISIPLAAATAVISAVVPYRLRTLGFSVITLYTVLFGGLGGAVLTGALSDRFGEVAALAILLPVACGLGGVLVLRASVHVRGDISLVVEEMLEEREERARQAAHGGDAPILQVRNLDFSYGKVQVLFGCDFDLHRGETLALLGTNGAGKSSLLRAISGLGMPDRGAIRLNGATITYLDAEDRVERGIVQLPGGKAIFPGLTVGENLVVGGRSFVWDQPRMRTKLSEVLDMFPRLTERIEQKAGLLSGGEQQQLALAKALLLEPEVLCIDELSLGLAPVVVQDLLTILERLKEQGQSMIIVEQSLNIALAIADRAIFMEKGQVKFEGRADDLLERDDLVRAVFLGGDE